MKKTAAILFSFAVMATGCSEPGAGGEAGTGGSGGSGGSAPPPPPQAVDQSCRDWCANEPEGPSCHQGPFESVQPCYEDCLSDYQEEAQRPCGDEWIAIKDCQIDLDCEDLFGDCDPVEDTHNECVRLANNREYCETNCPEFDIAQCEQDTTECRQFAAANTYCESRCPTQDRQECIAQHIASGTCEYREATDFCRAYCSGQDLSQCVDEWRSTGACEFNDGWTACLQYCSPIGSANRECADHWDTTGTCPNPGTGGTGGGGGPGGESTTWEANTTPAGSNGGPTATGGGCEVFVTALNTDINLQVTITLDVASDGANNITTGWTVAAQQFLLPTLGNAAELGGLSIAAEVTDATGGPIPSSLTAAATGQTIGAFTDGDTLTLETPGEITEGSAAVTPTGASGSTYNVNWNGIFALDLTLGGDPLITIDEDVCTFDVQGTGVDIPVP